MVSNQENVMIIKMKKCCKPVKSRLAKKSQIISTHILIMEVDFCPVLCIAEMPILRAFVAFSHFVWYRRISSNELQMV